MSSDYVKWWVEEFEWADRWSGLSEAQMPPTGGGGISLKIGCTKLAEGALISPRGSGSSTIFSQSEAVSKVLFLPSREES